MGPLEVFQTVSERLFSESGLPAYRLRGNSESIIGVKRAGQVKKFRGPGSALKSKTPQFARLSVARSAGLEPATFSVRSPIL